MKSGKNKLPLLKNKDNINMQLVFNKYWSGSSVSFLFSEHKGISESTQSS